MKDILTAVMLEFKCYSSAEYSVAVLQMKYCLNCDYSGLSSTSVEYWAVFVSISALSSLGLFNSLPEPGGIHIHVEVTLSWLVFLRGVYEKYLCLVLWKTSKFLS